MSCRPANPLFHRLRPFASCAALLAALAAPTAAFAAHTLGNGQALAADQHLDSENGKYRMIFHQDGRLAIYEVLPAEENKGAGAGAGQAATRLAERWSSKPNSPILGRATLQMQEDNNLVVYDIITGLDQPVAAWDSRTFNDGPRGTGNLVLADDGTLAIVAGGTRIWQAGVWEKTLGGGSSAVKVELPKERVDEVKAAVQKVGDAASRLADQAKKIKFKW